AVAVGRVHIVPGFCARRTRSTVRFAPAANVPIDQRTSFPVSWPPALALTKVVWAGSGFVIATLPAGAVPGLLTVIWYVAGALISRPCGPVIINVGLASPALPHLSPSSRSPPAAVATTPLQSRPVFFATTRYSTERLWPGARLPSSQVNEFFWLSCSR